ncbi:MAG: putative sigma-54 modulation protein [Maribacter sp.]|jgi:putative sigma-54 modulation protein
MKIKTQAVKFSADNKLIEFIDLKLSKLEQFYDRIISAEVMLKLENSGQVRDKIAEVRINIPGTVLITKETEKTFEAAIDSSVDSLKRQLIKHKEKTATKR